jgi:hypothetical protein
MQVAVIINRDRRCLYEFRKKQMRHSLNRGLEEMSAAPLHGVEFADERDDQDATKATSVHLTSATKIAALEGELVDLTVI